MPFSSTPIYETSNPSFSSCLHVSNTAGCSILDVIIWFPLCLYAYAIPLIAVLSLSLPPAVKYISFGSAFIAFATFSLASSTAFLFSLPILYIEDGFPYLWLKYGSISFNTSSSVLVVAALSK